MDIKTLEYLEQRVEKSKEIQKSIEILKGRVEKIDEATSVRFRNDRTGDGLANIEGRYGEAYAAIVTALVETFKEVAAEQIEKLEKEFTEL